MDIIEDDGGFSNIKVHWSGEDILMSYLYKNNIVAASRIDNVIRNINVVDEDSNMWEPGVWGIIQAGRRIIKNLVTTSIFDNFIMICVLINTIILSLDGLLDSSGDHDYTLN